MLGLAAIALVTTLVAGAPPPRTLLSGPADSTSPSRSAGPLSTLTFEAWTPYRVTLQSRAPVDADLASNKQFASTGAQFYEPTDLERRIVRHALDVCPERRSWEPRDPYELLSVLQSETFAGVPEEVRGITLAAACFETKFRASARGDCHLRSSCPARGWIQVWPKIRERFGVDDPTDSTKLAQAYLANVLRQMDLSLPKHCSRQAKRWSTWRTWEAAEVHAVRNKAPNGRCGQVSGHFRKLKRWRRAISAVL